MHELSPSFSSNDVPDTSTWMLRDFATDWARRGFRVFPCTPGTKKPAWEDWRNIATNDPATVWDWWTDRSRGYEASADFNIGYVTDDLVVEDVDCKKDPEALRRYTDELCCDTNTLTVATPSNGWHFIRSNPSRDCKSTVNLDGLPLDIKAVGGLAVAPGSIFANGVYRLHADLPIAPALSHIKARAGRPREKTAVNPDVPLADVDTDLAISQGERLARTTPGVREGGRGMACYRLALQMRDFGVSKEIAKDLIAAHWAPRCDPPFPFDDIGEVQGVITSVEHAYEYAENPIGVKSAEHTLGAVNTAGLQALTAVPVAAASVPSSSPRRPAALPPRGELALLPDEIKLRSTSDASGPLTEGGAAGVYLQRYSPVARYDHTRERWLIWDDVRWRPDETSVALLLSHHAAVDLVTSDINATKGDISRLSKAATASAALKLAAAHPAVATTHSAWDRDPDLLGTPGGVVNLKTGTVSPPDPGLLISRLAAIAPAERPDCPVWLQFLIFAAGGDRELVDFLQVALGYSLTAYVSEHALFFLLGPGKNGKSVFINSIRYVMGDYARIAAMDTFMASHGDRHPTDLAMLDGPRVAIATETEQGRAWAESRIKLMTGGDRIAARFMRQDFFEYDPKFKLWVVGNHAPTLSNVDEAIQRRINIVPFTQTPPNPDLNLEAKLRAEAPGILKWMIDGAVKWAKSGLQRPDVVVNATQQYFMDQDTFGAWLQDQTLFDPKARTRPDDLRASYCRWLEAAGEKKQISRVVFKQLIDRNPNISYVRINGAAFIKGIQFKVPATLADNVIQFPAPPPPMGASAIEGGEQDG